MSHRIVVELELPDRAEPFRAMSDLEAWLKRYGGRVAGWRLAEPPPDPNEERGPANVVHLADRRK